MRENFCDLADLFSGRAQALNSTGIFVQAYVCFLKQAVDYINDAAPLCVYSVCVGQLGTYKLRIRSRIAQKAFRKPQKPRILALKSFSASIVWCGRNVRKLRSLRISWHLLCGRSFLNLLKQRCVHWKPGYHHFSDLPVGTILTREGSPRVLFPTFALCKDESIVIPIHTFCNDVDTTSVLTEYRHQPDRIGPCALIPYIQAPHRYHDYLALDFPSLSDLFKRMKSLIWPWTTLVSQISLRESALVLSFRGLGFLPTRRACRRGAMSTSTRLSNIGRSLILVGSRNRKILVAEASVGAAEASVGAAEASVGAAEACVGEAEAGGAALRCVKLLLFLITCLPQEPTVLYSIRLPTSPHLPSATSLERRRVSWESIPQVIKLALRILQTVVHFLHMLAFIASHAIDNQSDETALTNSISTALPPHGSSKSNLLDVVYLRG
ncbi:hypothetical protein KCV07_g334, partial [Aureobasidium melanogenum]